MERREKGGEENFNTQECKKRYRTKRKLDNWRVKKRLESKGRKGGVNDRLRKIYKNGVKMRGCSIKSHESSWDEEMS